jgi:hypothetical protein
MSIVRLCDDAAINEWFVGVVSGDQLELISEGGAQLVAKSAASVGYTR